MRASYIKSARCLGCLILVLLFTACSDDETIPESEKTIYDLSKVEVSDVGYISVNDFYSKIVKDASEGNSESNRIMLEFAQSQLEKVKEEEKHLNDSLNNVHGTNGEAYGENWDHSSGEGGKNRIMWFQYCTLRYKAKGALGKEEELSELVIWPYGNVWSPQPDHVIVGCHCTALSNPERPSNFDDMDVMTDLFMLASFAHSFSQEALVVIPDYEGYGATHGNTHPYIDREILAHQVVEGTKAAIAWYQKKFKDGLAEDWKSVALGYSQGGHVAASVLRYCQEHEEDDLRMVGAVCGGGCYDPLATLNEYISTGRIYMPIATALMLKSCIDTQSKLKDLRLEELCTKEFINTGVFDWIQEKKYITEDIQGMLLKHSMEKGGFLMYCWSKDEEEFMPYIAANKKNGKNDRKWNLEYGEGASYCTPEAVFTPEVLEYFKTGHVKSNPDLESRLSELRDVLVRNSLYYGWHPWFDSGFTFFHSTKDEVVPYINVKNVDTQWDFSIKLPFCRYDYKHEDTYLHVASGTAFYTAYCGEMVDELLSGTWQPGRTTLLGGEFY